MRQYYVFLALLLATGSPHALAQPYNLVVVDSSFAPLKSETLNVGTGPCALIDENNLPSQAYGDCYDKTTWDELTAMPPKILVGLMDHAANVDSEGRKEFQKLQKPTASKIKQNYALVSHGSRSAHIAYVASGGVARIQTVRVVTAKSATGDSFKTTDNSATPSAAKNTAYENGCGLRNWSTAEVSAFHKGALQDHQLRLAKVLRANSSAKVVNLSLGYKKSWIAEDNPTCNDDQINKEYQVLKSSWRNLLRQFSDRIFVVAAGNENENFDETDKKENDLWAALSPLPNLVVVGSLNEDGTRFSLSNYGAPVTTWALGNNVPVQSPVPSKLSGYKTTVRGTSYSAPLVAGQAVKLFEQDPTLRVPDAVRLLKSFPYDKFEKTCSKKGGDDSDCKTIVLELLNNDLLWGDAMRSLKKGHAAWKDSRLDIRFETRTDREGGFHIENTGDHLTPVISLSRPENPYELLITLNHELVHYANSPKLLPLIASQKKIKNCITAYQLSELKDETKAFKSELKFWKLAPFWMHSKLANYRFESKLLALKNVNYHEYYQALASKLRANNTFIIRRYIELGKAPLCAGSLGK